MFLTTRMGGKRPKISYSALSIYLISIILSINVWQYKAWNKSKIIYGDNFSYYAYLPAYFIRHDITLQFLDYDSRTEFNNLWYSISPMGIRFTKMSIGWSYLNLPFFFLAHVYSKLAHITADGFSYPYQVAICIATLFYVILGIGILRKILLNYFSEITVAFAICLLVFATNLFNYTVFTPGMSHPIGFFLLALFLLNTIQWHKKSSISNSFFLGISFGLICLLRPTNIIAALIFLLYQVENWQNLKDKIILLKKKKSYLIIVFTTVSLLAIPQLLYWYKVSGKLLYYSYKNETFYFSRPHIIEGLFGFRKGWLVYSPVMILALLGVFKLKAKEWRVPLIIFTAVNMYVILSWWCWWYGGSFGARSFIESYAFLAIPLCSIIEDSFLKKYRLLILSLLCSFFIFLNVFQTIQFQRGIIHYDAMTFSAYCASFLKQKAPSDYDSKLCNPDYVNANLGIQERGDCQVHDHKHP
jgi:hypothetical protein